MIINFIDYSYSSNSTEWRLPRILIFYIKIFLIKNFHKIYQVRFLFSLHLVTLLVAREFQLNFVTLNNLVTINFVSFKSIDKFYQPLFSAPFNYS